MKQKLIKAVEHVGFAAMVAGAAVIAGGVDPGLDLASWEALLTAVGAAAWSAARKETAKKNSTASDSPDPRHRRKRLGRSH